jgi:hypothetical protein
MSNWLLICREKGVFALHATFTGENSKCIKDAMLLKIINYLKETKEQRSTI